MKNIEITLILNQDTRARARKIARSRGVSLTRILELLIQEAAQKAPNSTGSLQ